MNKITDRLARFFGGKSLVRKVVATAATAALTMGGLSSVSSPAIALSVDASAAAFNFNANSGGNATLISGASMTASNAVVKYTNITGTSIPGVSIDAVVTTSVTNSTVTVYDNPGHATANTDYFQVDTSVSATKGIASFTFDFYEGGTYTGANTGIPITLRNMSVTAIDLDGNTYCQFTDFTGFQSYKLAGTSTQSSSNLLVKKNSDDSTIPLGTTRFLATSCQNNNNIANDAVQVQYDSVTSFTAKFGTDVTSSTNYFGIAFKPLSVLFPAATVGSPVTNPSNQAPTSTNSTVYATSGQAQILQLADFGTYADADSNPFASVLITTLPTAGTLEKFVNGSWVPVLVNDVITVADITNGNLRYTGSADNSLQFKVYDGGLYSTSAYTMSILMSSQAQTITFNNPGAKTPTSPSFASGATASSGLTVTLTSLTPGVCTVSGLNIVPVAAGQCTIVATQSGNRSYSEAAPVTQTFPISTLTPQTITAPNPGNQTYSGSSYTITRTPTASSGLTVTMLSLTPSVCTVSGLVITIVGPGNCTIRNTQSGNGTYSAAPPVEYTFNVATGATNYTITYNGNNKTSGSVPSNTTGNGSVNLATNSGTLARTGYMFNGWNTQANGQGTHYAVGVSYNLTADVTLYAEWVANTYTITYNGNNKTSGSVPSNTTGNGSVTLENNSGTLAKTGYTLTGWNTQADGQGTHYDLSTSYFLNADVTLYAEWTATVYTITYNGNNKTSGSVPSHTTGYGSVTLAANTGTLARTAYHLTGWNTQADGQGTHYDLSNLYNLTADVTLYAEWTHVDYTITYNGNNKTTGTTPGTTVGHGTVNLAGNSGNMTRNGYVLTGWNTHANGQGTHYDLSETYNLTGDVTLYAEWTAIEYTIIYDGNNNTSGSAPSHTVGFGSVNLANSHGTLARTGYTFGGWNTQADGLGITHPLGDTYDLTADVTLYAIWTPIDFTITYNGNSKTGGSAPSHTTGHGSVNLASNSGNLVRTGHVFNGWNTEANGSGTHYDVNGSYTLNADITLYAEWTSLVFTLTFDGNNANTGIGPQSLSGYGSQNIPGNIGSLVKTGYIFKGWNTQANGSGTRYTTGAVFNLLADTTLYAEWELIPAIAYDPNGAHSGNTPNDIPVGSPITIDPNTGNLQRAGFKFTGWNTSPTGNGQHFAPGETPNLPVGTVLYAEWVPITPLAMTGSGSGTLVETGTSLVGLGMFLNAVATIRRRRIGFKR